jgi:phage terminase large subunit-like protein
MACLDETEQLLSDESQALESIYGDEIRAIFQPDREYIIALTSIDRNACQVHILLGPNYPEKPPTEISIEGAGLSNATREAMRGAMLLAMEPGEPGIYAAVEAAREVLDSLSLAQQASNPSASSASAQEIIEEVTVVENSNSEVLDSGVVPPNFEYQQSNSLLSAAKLAPEDSVEIISGPPVTEKKSVFQAHLALDIKSRLEVARAMQAIDDLPKVSRATHNISAYRFMDETKGVAVLVADNDDDGEDGAGVKLAQLLDVMKAQGVLIVVSRWYGGIHLGPDRFKLINNAARSLLTDHGFGRAANAATAAESGSKGGKKKKGLAGN